MKFINKTQLAFVLDIKIEDARAKMVAAYCKSKGIEPTETKQGPALTGAVRNVKGKIEDKYPQVMEIDMIARYGNLPDLPWACDDIENNYLRRPGSKRWILADYPEKQMTKQKAEGKPFRLKLPPGVASMVKTSDQRLIEEEWRRRYPKAYPQETKTQSDHENA